jgi:hypothetical protein
MHEVLVELILALASLLDVRGARHAKLSPALETDRPRCYQTEIARDPPNERHCAVSRGASSMPYCFSISSMSASVSQIGTSAARVTLSFASMKRWSVSLRSLLLPTAGMMRAALSVAAFSLRVTMACEASANSGRAWDARALISSSLVKSACGQTAGMLSRKSATAAKRVVELALAARLSSSVPSLRKPSFVR